MHIPKISLKGVTVVCGPVLRAKTHMPFHVKGTIYYSRLTESLGLQSMKITTTGRYYEGLNRGKAGQASPFHKVQGRKLLVMARLYDSVVFEGHSLWTFAIVTTGMNKEFSWLHDRKSVFLSDQDALNWWPDTSSQMWTPELSKMV